MLDILCDQLSFSDFMGHHTAVRVDRFQIAIAQADLIGNKAEYIGTDPLGLSRVRFVLNKRRRINGYDFQCRQGFDEGLVVIAEVNRYCQLDDGRPP